MLIANSKTIGIIGFPESTMTQEAKFFLSAESNGQIEIFTPEIFFNLPNKQNYQYFVGFSLDTGLRKKIIELIEQENLDCITYIHDTVVKYDSTVDNWLGRGSFISPYSTVLLGAKVGRHCIIETYCLVSHYSELKNNVILHSGTLVAGKTTLGENSVWNFRSTALNGLDICGDIEVGGASTVTKSLTEPGYYVGSPARRIGNRKTFEND